MNTRADAPDVTTGPIPGSHRVYVTDETDPSVRVPMREIPLHGGEEPLTIYDTSGPYTDPDASIDIRAAVIRNGGILLVRERSDGLWAMPGGFADIGSSPSENIEREVLEEAGLRVAAQTLYAVRHKARHPYPADPRDFYKLFFLCSPFDAATPIPGPETSEAAFFAPDALPDLSLTRNLEKDIHDAFQANGKSPSPAMFD